MLVPARANRIGPFAVTIALLSSLVARLPQTRVHDGSANPSAFLDTTCEYVPIAALHNSEIEHVVDPAYHAWLRPRVHPFNRAAVVCYPAQRTGPLPLHVYSHGDMMLLLNEADRERYFQRASDGRLLLDPKQHHPVFAYLRQLAEFGFAAVAHLSCEYGCQYGSANFLDVLEVFLHFEGTGAAHLAGLVNHSAPYSVSGLSAGSRAVMILAALRDTPSYLSAAPALASRIRPAHRATIARIGAVIAFHPDSMFEVAPSPLQTEMDGKMYGVRADGSLRYPYPFNPDIGHYQVGSMPMLFVTGTDDMIQPLGSAWSSAFAPLSTPDRVFLNVAGAKHELGAGYAAAAAHFARAFALRSREELAFIYGDARGSTPPLAALLPLAGAGARNNGGLEGEVDFLACRRDGDAAPFALRRYCEPAAARYSSSR